MVTKLGPWLAKHGSKRNSKTQCPILMKFATDITNYIVYKINEELFLKRCFIFELYFKIP